MNKVNFQSKIKKFLALTLQRDTHMCEVENQMVIQILNALLLQQDAKIYEQVPWK